MSDPTKEAIDGLTDAQLSDLLDGWAPVPPAGSGLTRRQMQVVAISNRLTTGQLDMEALKRVAA